MDSYDEALRALGARARQLRLLRDLRQDEVAERSGVGLRTVVRFERTGRSSVENVLRIAMALGTEGAFDTLFALPKFRTLDEALAQPEALRRQRVRRRR